MDQHLNGKPNGHYNGTVKAAPDQMQPHNIEAEEAVLGGCLIDIDAIISVSDFLTPADFFLTKHQWVFEVILHLFRQRKPVDMLLVNDELDRREQLDAIGGPPFLSDLANRVPTSLHTEYYGRIVERTSSLRRLITAGTQIVQLAHDDTGDLADIQDQAGRAIFDALDSAVRRDFVTLAATMDAHIDRAEYLERNADALIALPTGLKSLDNLLGGGMFKGDLDILAGRPWMGKTSLALGIAL